LLLLAIGADVVRGAAGQLHQVVAHRLDGLEPAE
jgi:hypothetical protein